MGPGWRAWVGGAVGDGKHARRGPGWKTPTAAVIVPVGLAIASPVGGVNVVLHRHSLGAVVEGLALIVVGLAAMTWIIWFWLLSSERRQAARRLPPHRG